MHKQSRKQYRTARCKCCDTIRQIAVGLKSCDRCCERAVRHNRANKRRGICPDCSRPLAPGRARCQRHLDLHAQRARVQCKKLAELRLCRDCQTPIAPGERGCRCDYHKYRHMIQERKRRAERKQERIANTRRTD